MKHPPYHLRLNKAIDRFVLIEIVRKLGNVIDHNSYTYYGFGGPFLEDFRLFNEYCPEINLVSIETNKQTYLRQKFHKFTKKIVLIHENFNNFLSLFDSTGNEIFWLDYTDISLDRFDEFRRLLQKSDKGTIVRITLRMDILNNPYQRQKAYENNEEQFEKDLSDFTEEFTRKHSEFLPSDFSSDKLRPGELPLLIQEMVQISAEKALPASCGLIFQPINSTYYSDGTPMISITGIVADLGEVPEIKKCFKGWNGGNFDWNSPEEINVPILSIKERLLLEKHLPVKTNTGICLSNALGYKIEKSESRNIETLRQYANFNRYYPYFTKVSI